MSKAEKAKLAVTLSDPRTKQERTFEIECGRPLVDEETMIEEAPEAVRQARRTFATHFVDYDAYESDSAYADMLDKVAARFVIEGVGKPGDVFRHWVYGLYGDPFEEGTWADWVDGVDRVDAAFGGLWQMAVNSSADPNEDFERFLATMSDMKITDCAPDELTQDEAIALLRRIVDPNGDRRTAIAEAKKKLARVDLSLRKGSAQGADDAPEASPSP